MTDFEQLQQNAWKGLQNHLESFKTSENHDGSIYPQWDKTWKSGGPSQE